ncbi:copper homeostasis protein CutC [Lutibacter flavus]|uniref:PF03932 family protein CutC n=1 Tax=Lutibacter flavus TaxID=691689 RepID=A0A238VKA3_9FLAO|nr:copper homeostasis protein CutC [Lutibacter flavus]SNR34123.1 copper homeostasis protein [Lutibacter flavus]
MNIEICTDSVEGVIIAQKYGAKRIELCSALSVGGLTPSIGLIQQSVLNSSVEVHVLIRPREGDFKYSKNDIEVLKSDIKMAKKAGAKGVVFGVLTENNEVSNINQELVTLSKSLGLEVTFHRAFDFVNDFKIAIEKIIEFGFDRLLTSGLQPTVDEGLDVISYLQANYGSKIQIMAGSGINVSNALKIADTGIKNIHFTARKTIQEYLEFGMGIQTEIDEEKIKEITNLIN